MRSLFLLLALGIGVSLGCGSAPPVAKGGPKANTPDPSKRGPATPDTVIPKTATEIASLDPLAYLRPTSYAALHVDVANLVSVPWIKDTKRTSLRGIGGDVGRDLPGMLDQAQKVESVTIVLGPAEPKMFFPFSGLMVFRSPEARSEMLKQTKGKSTTFEGVTYTRTNDFDEDHTCTLPVGDRAIYLGSETGVREIISAKGAVKNETLSKLLGSVISKGQVVAAVNAEPARKEIAGLLEFLGTEPQVVAEGEKPKAVDPDFGGMPILELPAWTKSATVAIDLSGGTLVDLVIEAAGEDKAGQWTGFLQSLAGLGTAGVAAAKAEVEKLPGEHPFKALHGMAEKLVKLEVKQTGSKVTVALARPAELDRLPAVFEGLAAEQDRIQRENIPKQLGLGVMNALNFNGDRIEKLVLTSDDGKVVYSWRVTILPMLEQYAIYNKIDFNQPWDSEKNRELFKTEIEMYKNDYAKTPGTTTWKMIPKFRGGVMLVEGGEGSAVPWAPHDEVKLDGDDPLVSFGKEPAGGYRVVMSDGSAKRMAGADLKELLKKPQ